MRHFDYLDDADRQRLFAVEPEAFDPTADIPLLAVALGATLYCPATRPALADDIVKRAMQGVASVVVCLEDAIADADVVAAEHNAVAQLNALAASGRRVPLVFVRVRAVEQIPMIVDGLGSNAGILAGFVAPKFTETDGGGYLRAVADASAATGRRILLMPVLESPEIIFSESRAAALLGVRRLLDEYRAHVLAVRIGATDLCGVYGLRRSRGLTVYDVRVVADLIADVVNVMGRARGGDGYVITGPVWEYFSGGERLFKPQLRESPFAAHDERRLRAQLIASDLDGLIREVTLDRANGLVGKTVIHPSHVPAVHALSVVSYEEYSDALDVVRTEAGGGVASSAYRNKMNESKPHAAWALRTLVRSRVFGVAREDVSFVDLLGASLSVTP